MGINHSFINHPINYQIFLFA